MKAIIGTHYGHPNTLQVKELEKPVPGKHEVLVRIRATTINDFDWSLVRGKPYPYRLLFGLLKPKHPIAGIELAGTVEAIGDGVTAFEVGDAVYGDLSEYGWGSFAEYACVRETALVLKPENMTFEEAAAIPHASLLAAQGLIDIGTISRGQKILINGAGGGMGTFGLQIAKTFDAEVTGVDSGEKLGMMQSLGFDRVIDYRKEDFTQNGQQFDLILDAKTTRPPSAFLPSLKPAGKYVTVGGHLNRLLQLVTLTRLLPGGRKKPLFLLSLKPNKNLAYINQLFEAGKLKPVIDGPYSLEDIPYLLQYFGEGKHKGKVVISIT